LDCEYRLVGEFSHGPQGTNKVLLLASTNYLRSIFLKNQSQYLKHKRSPKAAIFALWITSPSHFYWQELKSLKGLFFILHDAKFLNSVRFILQNGSNCFFCGHHPDRRFTKELTCGGEILHVMVSQIITE